MCGPRSRYPTVPVAAAEGSSEPAADTTAREATLGATSTTAGATTTAFAGVESTATTVPITAAEAAPEPEMMTDRKEMTVALRDAEAPAYLAFMASAPEQSKDSGSGDVTTTVTTGTGDSATPPTR